MALSRRGFLATLPATLAFTQSSLAQPAPPVPPRPHIILFLSDDLGWDIAGCYGNAAIKTPNIDALAKQGLRFTRAFAASPTCSPSRAALYTGLHSARNGLMGNHTGCKEGITSMAQQFQALGYRTVLVHKSHVKPESVFPFEYVEAKLPTRPDRDRKYRMEGLDTRVVDTLLAEHAKSRAPQPLLLIVADSSPHVVWEKNHDYDPAKLPLPPIMIDTPLARQALANYYQEITTSDQNLGQLMVSLRRTGLADDAITIFASDQGPEWPRSKWTLYDAGIRVPFIVRWPGKVAAGKATNAMISFVDVLPTLLQAAGGKAPAGLDGQSFLPILLGQAKQFRKEIYASHSGDGTMNRSPQRCVRDERFKYILNLHPERRWTTHWTLVEGIPNSHKTIWDSWVAKAKTDPAAAELMQRIEQHPAEELYDTQADPHELRNLAADPKHKATLVRLRASMKAMRTALKDPSEE